MPSKPETGQRGQSEKGPRRKWAAAFIQGLRDTRSVSHACKLAGIKSRNTAYAFRAKCERFRKEWDEAWSSIVDDLEQSALDRAINGFQKPVIHEGEWIADPRIPPHVLKDMDPHERPRLTIRTYEQGLTIFMLKKNRPERYGDESVGEAAEEIAAAIREMMNGMIASIPTIPPPPEPPKKELLEENDDGKSDD